MTKVAATAAAFVRFSSTASRTPATPRTGERCNAYGGAHTSRNLSAELAAAVTKKSANWNRQISEHRGAPTVERHRQFHGGYDDQSSYRFDRCCDPARIGRRFRPIHDGGGCPRRCCGRWRRGG